MATTDPKYQIGTPENKKFLDISRDNLIAFGRHFPAVDGSSYWLVDDGTPWKGRNRATWITCRMTHVYSLATLLGVDGAAELVDDGIRGLNANMHSVEACLAVADVTGDESWRERAGRIIEHVLKRAEENDWRIPEHFTSDWVAELEFNADKPDGQFKPYGATPGHGIEWARLITQYALSMYGKDGVLGGDGKKCLDAAEHLFNRAVKDAWNADGAPGIVYTTDWEGKPVVHDRMHWTLAEGVNTAATLYHVTGKRNTPTGMRRSSSTSTRI